jgi:hypothetical protein
VNKPTRLVPAHTDQPYFVGSTRKLVEIWRVTINTSAEPWFVARHLGSSPDELLGERCRDGIPQHDCAPEDATKPQFLIAADCIRASIVLPQSRLNA